jgi:hypothetical protein
MLIVIAPAFVLRRAQICTLPKETTFSQLELKGSD